MILLPNFPDPTGKSWSYYNSNSGNYTDLPAQIESVDWMPTGDKIMYIWLENGKATLNISDPDSKSGNLWRICRETDDIISVSRTACRCCITKPPIPAATMPLT